MMQSSSHNNIGRRFYFNMKVSSRLLLNLIAPGRIEQKLVVKSTRNKSLEC